MKILIGCEFSGTVRNAFLKKGHNAISCDLLPTESPGPHYQGNIMDIINDDWDLGIFHPPCTYLTISAEWAYKNGPYHQKIKPGTLVGKERRQAREEALEFVKLIMNAPIKRIAIENPVGVISSRIRPADQYIQPYDFGDDASKKTGLWLKNLPLLKKTKYVEPRWVNGKPRWGNQTDSGQNKIGPSDDRWKRRSEFFPGWAEAMADQWSF